MEFTIDNVSDLVSVGMSTVDESASTDFDFRYLQSDPTFFSVKGYTLEPGNDPNYEKYPAFYGRAQAGVKLQMLGPATTQPRWVNFADTFDLRRKNPNETKAFDWVFVPPVNPNKDAPSFLVNVKGSIAAEWLDQLIKEGKASWFVQMNDQLAFDIKYKDYAPPIKESIVTFKTDVGETAQPYELTSALLAGDYGNLLSPNESLIFELIDKEVELPVAPFRLHYNGYFTTLYSETTNTKKLVFPSKYYFRYVGILPETTSLVGNKLPLQSKVAYMRNQVVSAMATLC